MSYLKQREEKMASEAQESSYEKSYRKRFPKGKDWVEPKPNPFGHCGLNPSSYHGMEVIGYSKDKVVDFDSDEMFQEKLLVCNTKDMTRKELDYFADRMRIERNSYFLRKEESEEKIEELENEIEQLKQQYYFDMRNKQMQIEVLKNQCK
jgi:hypothetical protein